MGVDIVLLVIIGLFGVAGMRRGFLSQVVLLIAFLVGIWLTIRFSGYVSKILITNFGTSVETTPLWSFGLTFAGAVVGIYFLTFLFKGTMRLIRVLWLDKVLGLAFGMLKGALLVSVVLALLNQTGTMKRIVSAEAARRSTLYAPVERVAPAIYPYLKDFGEEAWAQLMRSETAELR